MPKIENRDLLATCWTWAGDAAPARGDEKSPIDMSTRVKAVSEAGWEGVGIAHADVAVVRDSVGLPALKAMLDDHGIRHVELEFISNWWATGDERLASDKVRRELFEAAAALGVTTIKVGAELGSFGKAGGAPIDHFASSFNDLATDAGNHGVRVALEPMPMSNIMTIADGAALVKDVANASGGLVVDTWHIGRANTPFSELPKILPMEYVFVVELDDADAEVVGSLWDDTINQRRLPGEGVLDTAAFVAAMHQAGWRGHWGVEIISEEQRQRPLDEAVSLARSATLATIDRAEELLRIP